MIEILAVLQVTPPELAMIGLIVSFSVHFSHPTLLDIFAVVQMTRLVRHFETF